MRTAHPTRKRHALADGAPLLRLEDVQVSYGGIKALRGVSLEVKPGEIVAMIGANGAGKTTTLKTVVRLLPLAHGSISYAGEMVSGLTPEDLVARGVSLVPEGRAIFPNLSVRENLICGAANRHRSTTPWTLERVYGIFPRLKEREGNLGANLSGGEQQMLAIGRALMTNPLLLILDEATEGLAPLIRKEIWNCLGGLKQTGLSMLVIDKNLKALCQIADHHYVLEKGHVVWQGSTEALKADWAQVQVHVGV